MIAQSLVADRYEIKELLGEGGMGVVYRAIDVKTKSSVAFKTMRDVSDPLAVELFSKEWSVLASISHPNIVDIRDVGEIDEHGMKKPFFVMPLLPGATLAKLIETSSSRLTVERVVAIITQVCRGLQAAHEKGLVHRDIKPSNIFVMEDDTAKIIDFGVVYLAGSHSVTGQKGTWQYMAPEQIEMKPASPVSDIFSLGVVCYEALTGRKPFACKTPAETAEAVRRRIPPPITEINPAVSQIVSMVIHKAMAKAPIHRFSSARDFGDILQKAYHNQPIDRFDSSKIQPRIERAKKTFAEGDSEFASEILIELETEGHIDPEIALLRLKIDQATRQKKIRQLLEAARTRVEQDEIPLALEKLQEILEIDPENADAHAMRGSIEKQRNERQIESWMNLARRHMERHDFTEARQALNEVFKIRQSDPSARELLRETDRREKDASRVQSEKEQLYGSALKAYNNGEISTALSKLERLLDLGRHTPDASVPDRDSVYQGFYNQIRSERDSIHNAYEEARRNLSEKNFSRALEICDDFVAKYPGDAIFQALKLEAVEQGRQELSAYIAEIGKRVDAEPDLDRKVNIFKEACERYPNELQFQQSLKLTRERRDLVQSIVAKARHYEEKNLFTEAVGQWDILRNIYPKYPGIEVEVGQLMKRRDQQAKEESKARLIEEIDRALDSVDYARGLELSVNALAEYPGDRELTGLERLARQGMERSSEARTLATDAQTLCTEGHFEEAVTSLRRALELDPKNRGIREALVNALIGQAQPLMEVDWRAAEPLVQQASDLDAGHPGTRSLRTLITDNKRKEFVSHCLAEARDLQAAGNLDGALTKVEAGLAVYPNEGRLAQLQTTLQNSAREARRSRERAGDVEALRAIRQKVEQPGNAEDLGTLLDQSTAILQKHPDDPEIGSLAAEIQHWASASAATRVSAVSKAPADYTETVILEPSSSRGSASAAAAGASASTAPPAQPPVQEPPRSDASASASNSVKAVEPADAKPASLASDGQSSKGQASKGLSPFHVAIILGVLVLAGAAIVFTYLRNRSKPQPGQTASAKISASIQTTPSDATVTVNGAAHSGRMDLDSSATYDVVVSRAGYKTLHEAAKRPDAQWIFTLEPEPVRLHLSTAEKSGTILVDNAEKGQLTEGMPDLEVPADGAEHAIALRNGSKEILSFSFAAKPGETPRVSVLKPSDLIIVSSLGSETSVYSGSTSLRANLAGQEPQPIPSEGLKLFGVSTTNNELAFSNKDLPKILIDLGNAPVLYVGLNADTNVAYLAVQSNVQTARLFVDGREVRSNKPGNWPAVVRKPGQHAVKVTADGYDDYTQQVEFVKDKPVQLAVELKPNLVATSAFLSIEGGTPGAEVLVDGVSVKTLDTSGAARIEVTPQSHKISFRKDHFEQSDAVARVFSHGQEIKLGANEAKLKEMGRLQFQVTPQDAQVSYHRSDHTEVQHAKGRDVVWVPEGKYAITAEAAGYTAQSKNDVAVTPGQVGTVELKLQAEAAGKKSAESVPEPGGKSLFEDPSLLKSEGGWLKATGAAEYVYLKAGAPRSFNLTFADPGKNVFGKQKKMEWVVDYESDKQKVVYQFEGNKFERKATSGGKHFNTSITCKATDQAFQFFIVIEPGSVEVKSPSCEKTDLYESPDHDLTKGKIGVKRDIEFVIR
ncbi:MAG TPA: protein kinase [Bryobacteraceae bacterium]|jgi:serine/threonine-protein kinase|nr:protein kinase [Bryobacteraceae bacterium]